ncbi:PEPxxWA-CTERM sorting domain-containing protein (plasmid) [Polymorphobacter sp. PAMC 29334]|uniref:PEPxxWA-CTERM sorting domain-containing protein n=1 Tax=Polymorphobacter sp. PAMC 29334 TaxID=2862331 RepID=UPI001C7608E3|nr:PEPxxWA-CTERM sorting domain-containing protein [Polymorphobacter sp. PAMC 29334]QYE33384.1 PEPxxWA-CTERM sorting domain-containing protein [Polymorphobacter sp. PAMC 29334]
MSRLILLIAIAAMPAAATAATIDFNSAPQNMLFGPTYSERGFTLTGTGFEFPQSDGWAYSTYANDGTLTFNYKGPTYTLTKDGGGTFNFTSLDLGNVNNDIFGGTLRIAFDGGTPTALAIPMTGALQTFTFGMAAVTSVAFSFLPGETANNTLNSYARIDNLVVGGAVPEPASWAMMIAGFGGIGTVMRRRATKVVLA